MRYWLIGIALGIFWLALSGHYTPLLLSFGLLSVLLVVWFNVSMDRVDNEPVELHPSLRIVGYFFWLLWAIIKANFDVTRRIWDPRLSLDPQWRRLNIQVRSRILKTVYANSITLTPGTLTTDVKEDHFLVHALSQEGIDDLKEGEMERKVINTGM